MIYILILLIVCLGGGWLIGKGIGALLFGEKKETYTFHTTNVHHHTHHHEHKNISIIDEETKQKIFELKKHEEIKK